MDDTSHRGAPDTQRINLEQRHEVAYWTRVLDVSEDVLRHAVDRVGSSASAVREHLGKSRKPPIRRSLTTLQRKLRASRLKRGAS